MRLTRSYLTITRLSHNFETILQNYEMLSPNFKLVYHIYEMLNHNIAMVDRNHKILGCKYEMLSHIFAVSHIYYFNMKEDQDHTEFSSDFNL